MTDEISLLPLGASIQTFTIAGLNIVQGFPQQEQYVQHNTPYFGETIGRIANRISNAKTSLNGDKQYSFAANDGPNTLHGGKEGWGKRIWSGPKPVGVRQVPGLDGSLNGGESVEFSLTSPDGDEGFPGEVVAKVTYTSGKLVEHGREVTVLAFEYEAELTGGAEETLINMTNHSYFNLSGEPTIEGTVVKLCTRAHLPLDDGGIPTSGPTTYDKVETDKPFELGATEPQVDDCFVVNPSEDPSSVPPDTRGRPLTTLASAYHPKSKVRLEVLSTEPAFQFYTGSGIDVPAVEGAPARGARSGFCVEPSRYVNACNVDGWKRQMLLKKGEKYGARNVYKAWKE
ncbi:galactose mutarotase-like protein [Xylariomycetidae sp. FL2044]|nr:galactose mutarotase-like protein [Xylariomycetidae sp. FL2044]